MVNFHLFYNAFSITLGVLVATLYGFSAILIVQSIYIFICNVISGFNNRFKT